jgi:hypothetical protein
VHCAFCGQRVPDGYGVTLGRRHGFCNRQHRDEWALARVLYLEGEMNRIYIRTRGRAREFAHAALIGNVPSVGGVKP